MPLAQSPLTLLAQLRLDPGGPVSAEPGQLVRLRIPGLAPAPGGARLQGASTDVAWLVTDRDGHPLRPGADFTAPDGLSGPDASLVFPTQFGPPRSRAQFRVQATVRLRASVTVRRTLPAVTVSLPVLSPDQVRALMTHVGHTLPVVPGPRPHLGVAGDPPTLDLVGLRPIPLAVSAHWRADLACTTVHGVHHRARARGHRPTDALTVRRPWRAAFRLSAALPLLGPVVTDLIPVPPGPRSSGAQAHCEHAGANGGGRPAPGF